MAKILLTSGPTRQYIDPVRFISNASSGRMGAALAAAALERGHEVTIISGPVEIAYPAGAEVVSVVTTDEMLKAAQERFPDFDGVIGVAAPCDYRPDTVAKQKISKTGDKLTLSFVETPDVIANLGASKTEKQWVVGFALETNDVRLRALRKMIAKKCDLLVLNGPSAIDSTENEVEIFVKPGEIIAQLHGSKKELGRQIFELIESRLIRGINEF
ncbi:MAG: phosphopantothenoylcysteine decarboxylase [Planctomycetaceae bacterium]|nr:phosphopantothenoylcysteine decarboxylase [Planctomycetaceae bacterium]